MDWLSGKPCKIITLTWPANDAIIEQACAHSYEPPGTWSVLDDQILRGFAVREPDNPHTSVYLAGLRQAISSGASTATFKKIATLPFTAHRTSLLPDNRGFVTLEFSQLNKTVTLRTHDWGGAILNQVTADAAAAYGDLVISAKLVAICISSGREADPELYLAGNPRAAYRMDFGDFRSSAEIACGVLTGDQILVWNSETGVVRVVSIPQSEEAPLTHDASFQVCNGHIAIGGKVISSFGRPSVLLKTFAVSDPQGTDRTFSHGQNFEMDHDIGVIASSGSSASNSILVNYHQLDSRFTVVKNELLTGEIDSEPTSDYPPGLREFWDHSQVTRTLEGRTSLFLPSLCSNRVLVSLRIEDEDNRFQKFSVKEQYDAYGSVFFLYDFDQKRCGDLVNLTQEERRSLEHRLYERNHSAQVRIVERNFRAGIEEEDDMEYPFGTSRPQDYSDRLQSIYLANESKKAGKEKAHVLEFDEAPTEKKKTPRILFTQSAVWLPEDTRGIDAKRLALTSSGIAYPPPAGKSGFFFLFKDI